MASRLSRRVQPAGCGLAGGLGQQAVALAQRALGLADRGTLEAKLAAVAQIADQPEVHLRPNKLVEYKVVAMVMASAQRLGVTKIGLVGNEQFLQ